MDRRTLDMLHQRITTTRFKKNLRGVRGWLSPAERTALYVLGRYAEEPILEIGAWVGLSTACIAYGIRDSREQKLFITTELVPKPEHFRRQGNRMVFMLPGDTTERGGSSVETYRTEVEPVIHSREGVIGHLRRNLARLKLSDIARIYVGDFRQAPRYAYRTIFCDATHTPYEIALTVRGLAPFLAEGVVLACHDIDQGNESALRSWIPFVETFRVDSLLVGLVGH
jgi:hypothetical protein